MADITTQDMWDAIDGEIFAVVGMVSKRDQARTAGIVYTVHDRVLYFATARDEWKTRHIAGNEHVSVTIPIAKRVPFMPWIPVPAATITFSGVATVHDTDSLPPEVDETLRRGLKNDPAETSPHVVIGVEPVGEFVTYGVGVSLMQMRDTEFARGRVAVG